MTQPPCSIRVEEDSSIASEIIAHDVRFERKLRTRLKLGSKIRSLGIFIRFDEDSQKNDDTALTPSLVSWHPVRAYRAGWSRLMEIFSRKSLLNNKFLEKASVIRIRALIFDGKLRYDANELAALRRRKCAIVIIVKIAFFVRASRWANTEIISNAIIPSRTQAEIYERLMCKCKVVKISLHVKCANN